MTSKLFMPKTKQKIETAIVNLLNNNQLMNDNTVNSPRAVGDAVQSFLEKNIVRFLPNDVTNIKTSYTRRAMADFSFEDINGNYYAVDIKTHNLNTNFNMPNLTSVKRLAEFYNESKNYFVLLLVSYVIQNKQLHFKECFFIPVEYLDWSCLTLGALGWGQIQIANSNILKIKVKNTRKEWMLQLCDKLDLFYSKEISKIKRRIDHFRKIKKNWRGQSD
ncbi:MAG: hypothetical protein FWF55_09830 [Treponema sp.]|nr:hypothetical protein [Treponema sp.]